MGQGAIMGDNVKAVWIMIGVGGSLFWVALMEYLRPLPPIAYLLGFVLAIFLAWQVSEHVDGQEP
jgi:hypothetical protein